MLNPKRHPQEKTTPVKATSTLVKDISMTLEVSYFAFTVNPFVLSPKLLFN